jgi:hypothetical protein
VSAVHGLSTLIGEIAGVAPSFGEWGDGRAGNRRTGSGFLSIGSGSLGVCEQWVNDAALGSLDRGAIAGGRGYFVLLCCRDRSQKHGKCGESENSIPGHIVFLSINLGLGDEEDEA